MEESSNSHLSKHFAPQSLNTAEGQLAMPGGTYAEEEKLYPIVFLAREGKGDNSIFASLSTALVLRTIYRDDGPPERLGVIRLEFHDDTKSRPQRFDVPFQDLCNVARVACDALLRMPTERRKRPTTSSLFFPITSKLQLFLVSPGTNRLWDTPMLVEIGFVVGKDSYHVNNPHNLIRGYIDLFHSKSHKLVQRPDDLLHFISHTNDLPRKG